jgi:flagella basal body P-ring formation protein FlgA
MMNPLPLSIALLLAARGATGASGSGCVSIEGERILARDLAQAVPAFANIPADTLLGYAPAPGARRMFHANDLHRLAIRYNIPELPDAELCIERAMEPLSREHVIQAMQDALGSPKARIEVLELSRYPVPHGQIRFIRSALSAGSGAPVLWRGSVVYTAERRFAIWARVKIAVPSTRVVAVQNLSPGRRIEREDVRLEECEIFPSGRPSDQSLDQIMGRVPRRPIAVGATITANLLDAPKDVERGDTVEVQVHSGAAHLKLAGRAESAGRRGEAIPVRNLITNKSFSARIVDKDRVVVTTRFSPSAKVAKQ